MVITASFRFTKALIFLFSTLICLKTAQAQKNDTLYIVDKQAQFVGGQRALSAYWQRHFKIPFKVMLKKVDGEGIVAFKIDTEGRVQDAFIKQPLTPELDAAALKAVREMPRWQAAEKNGEKIEMGHAITYFVNQTKASRDGGFYADVEDAEKVVRSNGLHFTLWTGFMGATNDFSTYINPARFAIGLGFGYTYKRVVFAFEYDLWAISKIRKPFELDGQFATTDNRVNGLNFYFPIGYRVDKSKKWALTPYLAPTINTLQLKEDTPNNGYVGIATDATYSVSVGILADYLVGKQANLGYKGKHRLYSSFVRTRLNINPMNFAAKTGSTQLQGTAISLTVGFMGTLRTEK
jgi:TonB family protein